MNAIMSKFLGFLTVSAIISGLMVGPAWATSMTTEVTGVVTRAALNNPFGLFAVGDRIFAEVTYEDSLISPVGSSVLSVDTDPSFAFSVKIGPSFSLNLPDFSPTNNIRNSFPELTFQDGNLSGIKFAWQDPSTDVNVSSFSSPSFPTRFRSEIPIGVGEFVFFLQGEWDFSTAQGGGPSGSAPIPEPATFLLFGSGLAGLIAWRWGKSRIPGLR